MGVKTRAEIVEQGQVLAGRTNLTTQANAWLNEWLRTTYRSWTWPFLHKRLAGVALAQGTADLEFGNGSGGESLAVAHIYDPIRIYTSSKSVRDNVRVATILGGDPTNDPDMQDDSTRGKPQEVRIYPSNTAWGTWTLRFYATPDRAYLLALDYIIQPDDIDESSTGDDEVPLYPNDETMIQAVKCAVMDHMHKHEELAAERDRLETLKAGDKVRYGMSIGNGDKIQLDSRTFRRGDPGLGGGRGWRGW